MMNENLHAVDVVNARRFGRVVGCTMLMALASVGVLTGCRTLHHDEVKQEAEQRWSEVRGRFKYQLARQQYDGGLFHEAVTTAMESIALDPMEIDAYVVLARAQLELGQIASAVEALDAAAQSGLSSAPLIYTRGVILETRGDLAAAQSCYHEARSKDGGEVDYLLAEAECLVALNRVDEARSLLDEVGSTYDDRASVATLAAHVAVRAGDIDGAIEHYRVALAEGSASRTVPRELGLLFAQTDRCEQAVALLAPLIDDPATRDDEGLLRRTLAACYLQLGAFSTARDIITPHLTRHPDDALGQLLLAKASVALNDLMNATRAVDLAFQTAPNRTEVWFVRAVIQWRRGDFEAAADALYDVLSNDPDDVEAMCLLAEVLKATQRGEGAKGYFERALQEDPASQWARVGLSQPLEPRRDEPGLTEESLTVAQ